MIENQIIYNNNLTENLLLLNKITLLQNYEIIKCDNLNNNFYIKAFNKYINNFIRFYQNYYLINLMLFLTLKYKNIFYYYNKKNSNNIKDN